MKNLKRKVIQAREDDWILREALNVLATVRSNMS